MRFWKKTWGIPTPPKAIPPKITENDIDERFETLNLPKENHWKVSEIREKIKKLLIGRDITYLDGIDLIDLCDRKKYREFLKRRDNYLKKHQVMDADEFAMLFWNKNLQTKKIDDNNRLISWKYNKSDINQGILGICIFDSFLKQLKETPFFETLIRCSLQRNEKNNWRKCLIPFCNNEWKYEEISDEDIDFLKNSKYEGKSLISNTSLWFNIIETLLVKMSCNRIKYPELSSGYSKFNSVEYRSFVCDDFKTMTSDDLHDITYWALNADKFFLWENIKEWVTISKFNDEELEWLINLSKNWIIKLTTWVVWEKINKYIEKNVHISNDNPTMKTSIDGDANEKTLNERWYTLTVLHEAWPNEEISVWENKLLWTIFKIKWTNEWFVGSHAYSIEGMHKKNGETFVTIINPRYTWKKIDVPLKYVKEFFDIWIYWFDIDKMFVENEENSEVK